MVVKILDRYEISKSLEYSHLKSSNYIVSVTGHYKEVGDFGNSTGKRYFSIYIDISGINEIIFPCKTFEDAKYIMECASSYRDWSRISSEFVQAVNSVEGDTTHEQHSN